MGKQEFLAELRKGLSGLPPEDIEERLTFYSEMIDDRMEEGLSEEEAVGEIGTIKEVVSQILTDIPLTKIVKERVRPKGRLGVWEILFLVLGSPIWLSLLAAACIVILAAYIVAWSLICSLWAIEVSLAACSLAGVMSTPFLALRVNGLTGMAGLGAGLFCGGLSIFLFFGCKGATRGILSLTKKMALGIKSLFVGREDVQ